MCYTYNANGNLTQRDGQTLTWDAENRLASVLGNGINESYLYDDAGIRVQKTSGETTTYYPFPHYEVTVAASGTITATATYHFNGQPIALRQGDTLQFLHSDHLSSVALVTEQNGAQYTNQGYFAYGRKRSGGTLPTEHNYTGQRKDNSGLIYYNARYYDSQLGTFISPDTIVPDTSTVFGYNRYMYTFGNPLLFNDPSGHDPYAITVRSFAPFEYFGGDFHGDNRGYSADLGTTARVHQRIDFDTDKTALTASAWSDPSYHRLLPSFQRTEVPDSSASTLGISEEGVHRRFSFSAHYAGSNPLTPGAPAIDVFSNLLIVEDRQAHTLQISGQLTGDNFPATEAFIQDASGQSIFLGVGFYEGNPYISLWGGNSERRIENFSVTISVDEQGNFISVLYGNQELSITEWNKKFEEADPHQNGQ